MPIAGGQSEKLGNRYESVWTVDSLLDVLWGDAVSVTVEPFGDDAEGIEFIKVLANEIRESHSAKRQTTGNQWTLHNLTAGGIDHSVLGPLWKKLFHHAETRVVFVSGTAANELNELAEQARRCQDYKSFAHILDQGPRRWRRSAFEKYLLPLSSADAVLAFDYLRRTDVVGITERELIRRVEQRIRSVIKPADGTECDACSVRLLLAEIVFGRFGQAITRSTLLNHLDVHKLRERDLARDHNILHLIAARNRVYTRHVEADLVRGQQIERKEATAAFDALISDLPMRRIVIIGGAGLGKSCIVAQTVRLLETEEVPVVAIRLDVQTAALTSDSLGKALGFPTSPAVVLARVAGGRRSVLVIDQLDALSFASGRNQQLWDAFDELLRDAEHAGNMRVLLACRAFDAEHDPRLRRIIADGAHTLRINLELLDINTVTCTVQESAGRMPSLTTVQMEMLRTPLHLSQFLQGSQGGGSSFGTVQDLLDHYWNRKRRAVEEQLGRESRWPEIVERLAGWLSEHQTLSAPVDILDAWGQDMRAMASQCVLSVEDRTCRFFHETFFDYAFARLFVTGGGNTANLLLESGQEQHLFRRGQVRQILSYRRGTRFGDYLSELSELLGHPKVRFHIKKVILDWLHSLDQPTVDEWKVVGGYQLDPKLGRHVQVVPHRSLGWFEVLFQAGTWSTWLDSKDETLVSHAIWLLSMPEVMQHASDQVANLFATRMDGSETWRRRFVDLIRFADVHCSRAMFDMFLQGFRAGWFDEAHETWWYHFNDMPKEVPVLACEFAAAYLDRLSEAIRFERSLSLRHFGKGLSETFATNLAKIPPEGLVRGLLPSAAAAIKRTEVTEAEGSVDDRLGVFRLAGEDGFLAGLFRALLGAMSALASKNPETLDALTANCEDMPHRTMAVLLLRAWGANGPRYADRAIAFMLQRPDRLALGYAMGWARSGEHRYATSRAAISAFAAHCSAECYSRLEEAVLSFWPQQERPTRGFDSYLRLLLVESLPEERLTPRVRGQLAHLRDKHPERGLLRLSPIDPRGCDTVRTPIPIKALERMSDEQWVSAMRKYTPDVASPLVNGPKGGIHELCWELAWEAQANKGRFAALALRMPHDIAPDYFEAILRGLTDTQGDLPTERKARLVATQPLESAVILSVICRLHGFPNHPCGRTICSALGHLADRLWPEPAFDILTHYALLDPDPDDKSWLPPAFGGTSNYGGDPVFAGINSVRGGAAHAIARLLFADKSRWPALREAVHALVKDRSLAVRSVAVESLLALLNVDREEAVWLFLALVQGADSILGVPAVDRFLHHAGFSHYSQLRGILLAMAKAPLESARKNAARQITVAAFHTQEAEVDLANVLTGDESCRAGAAEVFAHNLGAESIRNKCRIQLRTLFNDESKGVRDVAKRCFRSLSSRQLLEEQTLIGEFIQSRSFRDGCEQLCLALQESNEWLPDVVCSIAERLVAVHMAETPEEPLESRIQLYVPELVLRVYEQSRDAETKTRCLNAIDAMLELGVGSLESKLREVER